MLISTSPLTPSNVEGLKGQFRFIQHSLPIPELGISELDGLHLNITIPAASGRLPANKIPVLVHIYGGGFGGGSNAWPQYNAAGIVRLSVNLGKPMMVVGIKSGRLV